MQANLDHCLDLIGLSEAGYSDHPKDPGGPTNHGITQRTLAAKRGYPVSKADVEALTEAEARQILAEQYAGPIRFDVLPAGVDYCVLDASVNSGPDRAIRLLQQALGMQGQAVDGVLGMHTKAVLDGVNDRDGLILSYCAQRLAFMRLLKTWGTFGNGWTSRVKRVQTDAVLLADGLPLPPARVSVDVTSQAKAMGPTKLIRIPSGQAAVATVGTIALTAATAAGQATGMLQPYGDVQFVRYLLLGLAVVSATASLVVALTRAKSGATL